MRVFHIDSTSHDGADAFQQMIALELATGSSLPNDVSAWPTGLCIAWNDAADAGAFDKAKTLGDMARAFLRHRLAKLNKEA